MLIHFTWQNFTGILQVKILHVPIKLPARIVASIQYKQAIIDSVMVRLPVVISPSWSLVSLDTYLSREREDCETAINALVVYKIVKAFQGSQADLTGFRACIPSHRTYYMIINRTVDRLRVFSIFP